MKTVMALIAVLALAGCSPETSKNPAPAGAPKAAPVKKAPGT